MIDRYNGNSGCNYLLGTFTVKGNTLQVHWPSATTNECADEALFQQETGFLSALTAVETFFIEDEILHLYVGDIEVMTMEPLEPAPFEGTTWQLNFHKFTQLEWLPPIPGTTVTAQFDGSNISGNAGCNDYTGSYSLDDRTIRIGELAVTQKMCVEPEGIMEQEAQFLENLQNTGLIIKHARALDVRDSENLPFMLLGAE